LGGNVFPVYELRLLMGANECPADCLRTVHRALVRNGRIDPARRRRRRSDYWISPEIVEACTMSPLTLW